MARRNAAVAQPAPAPSVRCAIYTRKSTSEGLDMDFSTLDAQREACEAYIKSQREEGWTALAEHYDDGGFTGGNMDRPAFQRLLEDIKEGKIDSVVVYKVDRLSRSLMDFARIMDIFEKHNVSFVSVTQLFNTATSMGRLMLNVLLSFAQFERELVSERTRDKIAAARRKGKWAGGFPILGYDIAPSRRLIVNEPEAAQVREIFDIFLDSHSIMSTVEILNDRGWLTKTWTAKNGKIKGGVPFDKSRLYRLLTNVAYIGKVPHKDKVYDGEHDAILDMVVWEKVQTRLQTNGKMNTRRFQNKYGALLRGILHCASCGCTMIHTFTKKKGMTYRYYVCSHASKRGWKSCPTKSVPAGGIEDFVVECIKEIGKDSALVEATIRQVVEKRFGHKPAFIAERNRVKKDIERLTADARRLVDALAQGTVTSSSIITEQIANIEAVIEERNKRLTELNEELIKMELDTVVPSDVKKALESFTPIWDVLYVKEKIRIINLLIEKVSYNGEDGTVAITFHPSGIKRLAAEMDR